MSHEKRHGRTHQRLAEQREGDEPAWHEPKPPEARAHHDEKQLVGHRIKEGPQRTLCSKQSGEKAIQSVRERRGEEEDERRVEPPLGKRDGTPGNREESQKREKVR